MLLNNYTDFRVYTTKVQSVENFVAITIELNGTNFQTTLNGKANTSHRNTASKITEFVTAVINRAYPVGLICISVSSRNPATLLGTGTWILFAPAGC
jgi:short subunit fatty acids transporter